MLPRPAGPTPTSPQADRTLAKRPETEVLPSAHAGSGLARPVNPVTTAAASSQINKPPITSTAPGPPVATGAVTPARQVELISNGERPPNIAADDAGRLELEPSEQNRDGLLDFDQHDLSTAEGARWYLRTPEGNQYGPATQQQLDQWLTEGRIDSDCHLLQEGWDRWKWATELYPQLDDDTGFWPTAFWRSLFSSAAPSPDDVLDRSGDGAGLMEAAELVNELGTKREVLTGTRARAADSRQERSSAALDLGLVIAKFGLVVCAASAGIRMAALLGRLLLQEHSPPGVLRETVNHLLVMITLWSGIALVGGVAALLVGAWACLNLPHNPAARATLRLALVFAGLACAFAMLIAGLDMQWLAGRPHLGRESATNSAARFTVIVLWLSSAMFFAVFLGQLAQQLGVRRPMRQAMRFAAYQAALLCWLLSTELEVGGSTSIAGTVRLVGTAVLLVVDYLWLSRMADMVRRALNFPQPAFVR